jgi:hypothetical protein
MPGVGVLNVAGAVSFNLVTTFRVNLNGIEPGADYSQVQVAGVIDSGKSNLELDLAFEPPVGSTFEILTTTDPAGIIGAFAGLDEGSTFSQDEFTSESGFIPVPRATIHRLRKTIDAHVGAGAGKQLIETGCVQEYRLTIAKAKIAERVGVTRCFFELVDMHVVTNAQADTLRRTCPACILRETEELAGRD